jgi:hypothetical protein
MKIKYTDPNSVQKIMDKIGTKGVVNYDDGLVIIRGDKHYYYFKGQVVDTDIYNEKNLSKIQNESETHDNWKSHSLSSLLPWSKGAKA